MRSHLPMRKIDCPVPAVSEFARGKYLNGFNGYKIYSAGLMSIRSNKTADLQKESSSREETRSRGGRGGGKKQNEKREEERVPAPISDRLAAGARRVRKEYRRMVKEKKKKNLGNGYVTVCRIKT